MEPPTNSIKRKKMEKIKKLSKARRRRLQFKYPILLPPKYIPRNLLRT